MKVHTGRFEASHGKKPRGKGIWTFELSGSFRGIPTEFQATGTYTEARKEVAKEAKDLGYTLVTLLP
jgi:1,4-alpha-glucan branching enzyme